MSASNIRLLNLFVDGRGHAGEIGAITPPKLTIKTEEDRSGGRDAPIAQDVGMELLTCDYTLNKYDPDVLSLFGLINGQDVPHTIRGAVDRDGTVVPVVYNLRGIFTEIDNGELEGGKKVEMKCSVALSYYKLTIDGKVIHEIDVNNAIRVINGVDQLQAFRDAAGL